MGKGKERGRDGKGKIGIPSGIYIAFGRVCHWDWKCMEVSLYSRKVRRRGVCAFLPVFPCYYGAACYDNGVCGRACQQKKYYKEFPAVGKTGDKVAFARLCRDGGQLLPHDVLYDGSGLDDVLFLPDADGTF